MAEAKRYWLMKSEPSVYSIDDLQRDGSTSWEGVRNYQARNFMRDDMRLGDGVLFYHSNAKPMGIYGVAEVVREAYPDDTAFDPDQPLFRPQERPGAADLADGRRRLRAHLQGAYHPGGAEGHPRSGSHDGDPQGQPPIGAAGDAAGVGHRHAYRVGVRPTR